MIVTIHQPDFVPYLGFFQRLLSTDHLIYLDDVQFIRRGWQHRDKIKTKNGASWISLNLKKGDYQQNINQVILSQNGWESNHLNAIKDAYCKAPYFDHIFPNIEKIYKAGYLKMIDLNMAFINYALNIFKINVDFSLSSEYKLTSTGTYRLLELVQSVGGTEYLTGIGSRDYLDESIFNNAGIKVAWQNFNHPKYSQMHGEFIPMLSCIDLFMNCGEHSAEILRRQ